MQLGLGIGLNYIGVGGGGSRSYAPNYDPIVELGGDLYEWWSATRADTLSTLTDSTYTNAVSSWKGILTGADLVQSTPALKPWYSPNTMGGGPCLLFDGTQQYLTCTDAALLALLPDGAEEGEIWALLSQDALPADTTERYAAGYCDTSVITGRTISRVVATSVNRARGRTGIGASAVSCNDATVDLSGVHVVRHIIKAAASAIEVDGTVSADQAAVPATINTRIRVGCIPAAGASNYWQGKIADVLFTKRLSTQKAADLHAYLG